MDGLTLLKEAQAAGLTVEVQGNRLYLRGPRRAEPIARRLLAHKSEVLVALTARPALTPAVLPARALVLRVEDLDPALRIDWEERAAILEYEGGLPRERAEAVALTEILGKMYPPDACTVR
jgi:hypothetical protein